LAITFSVFAEGGGISHVNKNTQPPIIESSSRAPKRRYKNLMFNLSSEYYFFLFSLVLNG